MTTTEIRGRAKSMGVNPIGKNKTALVRAIQTAEHNRPCYNTGESATCGQTACAWRTDCK